MQHIHQEVTMEALITTIEVADIQGLKLIHRKETILITMAADIIQDLVRVKDMVTLQGIISGFNNVNIISLQKYIKVTIFSRLHATTELSVSYT